MKYKVLLTGTNQLLISEFFNHMEFSFECMSSSTRPDDILCHIKYFHPDALAICLYNENKSYISGLYGVLQKLFSEKITLIVIGEEENCELFEKTLPMAADLVIRKPASAKGLEEQILSYFDHMATEKEIEERHSREMEEREKESEVDAESVPEAVSTPAPANKPEQETGGKKHILIVDDDSTVLKLVKGFLGDQYNVATAISGKIALRFLEKKKTDLILLDYEMPEESGAQVLQKIRSNEDTKNLPVIFLTGVMERERIQEVLELKPQGYLLKPIDTERLSAALKNVLKE